jgi:hypothetical protein
MARLGDILMVSALAWLPTSAIADTMAPAADAHRRLTLQIDSNYRSIKGEQMSLWRADAAFGVAVSPFRWLSAYSKLHVGRTHLSFNYGLDKDFLLTSQADGRHDLSLEFGLAATALRWRWLSLDAFVSYEFTPNRPRFSIASAGLASPFGDKDITDYCRDHADFRYDLSQLNAGLNLRARFGRWMPRIGLQYQRLSAVFDPRLDGDAAALIGLFGFDPEKAKNDLSGVKHIPAISAGLMVRLPYDLAIDVEGTTTPTQASDFWTIRFGLSWSPF